MRFLSFVFLTLFVSLPTLASQPLTPLEIDSLLASNASIQGEYKTIMLHEGKKFYQFAKTTLRAVNSGNGQLKISANVLVFFGDLNSNEYLTYEFDECSYNFITGQISMKNDMNDVSLIGILKDGQINGEWFSKTIGRVGTFQASKNPDDIKAPDEHTLIQSLTGLYQGSFKNTNPQSNLPERVSLSFVSTQTTSGTDIGIKISGNTRFYLGDFNSTEYVELKIERAEFNFYSRFLTVRTMDYGLTFKGTMSLDGVFNATLFSDGLGEVGKVNVSRMK